MLATHDRLAERFRRFADVDCPEDALYQALCRIVADDAALLDLLTDTPAEQQRPNLWLAAVHDRLLEGAAHPLADYFASCGGERAPDTALAGTVLAFVQKEAAVLRETMRTRSTQTNEAGRCAVLWPALQVIAQRAGGRPLALLDVGCSAGLNLGVDGYRYDYGEFELGAAAAAGVPLVACRLLGAHRPDAQAAPAQIAQRLGIDPFPIDVDDERAVRWLRACLWPGDRARASRFEQAVALARRQRWAVRREVDCTAAVAHWLDGLPAGVQPVVFNSWVLTYFEAAALRHHIDTVVDLVRSRGAMWLSAEGPALRIGPVDVPAASEPEAAQGSLWTLCSRADDGVAFEVLARSHPHGRWMEWLIGG